MAKRSTKTRRRMKDLRRAKRQANEQAPVEQA